MIVCSKEDEEKSHILSRMHLHKRTFTVSGVNSHELKQYLTNHFVSREKEAQYQRNEENGSKVYASAVDSDQ